MTMTTTDIGRDVAELRAEVTALREELARRDVEQMEMECVVEHLDVDASHFRGVLCLVVQALYGRDSDLLGQLYRGRNEPPMGRVAEYVLWKRPARRWAQFGPLADVKALAAAHEVTVKSTDTRESIIRRLWSRRELHDVIPGAVGPYR